MFDKRLIEDYLPIREISKEAAREKSIRQGHISTLHLWWARRPLVACRAAVYASLVPAPKERNARGPKSKFIQKLCRYQPNPHTIKEAIRHIYKAHAERLSKELGKKITAKDIEEGRAEKPKILDMFAGGGSIPLEALRLGCDPYAVELNPVAHIIELATLVYPQKFGRKLVGNYYFPLDNITAVICLLSRSIHPNDYRFEIDSDKRLSYISLESRGRISSGDFMSF